MEPEMDRNIREEIVQIVTHFSELCQRLYHTEEGENIFMRWQPICLRQDGEKKSVVRYLGDQMPRVMIAFNPFLCYYKTVMESVFTRRSLIREIANSLPIRPSKRPYFYVLHQPADVNTTSRGLKNIHGPRFVHSTPCRDTISPCSIVWDSMNESCRENTYLNSMAAPDEAVRKISALEDELNRLRAQIAGFVLKQDNSDTTSVQVTAPPAPPPLPPPPPPLPPTSATQTPKKNTSKRTAMPAKNANILDMTAILKDISQVKLKAVERSPGGTPVRRAPRKTKASDPASIIADALKNKFAKSRIAVASPDKENLQSPGNSFSQTPSPQLKFRKPLTNKN